MGLDFTPTGTPHLVSQYKTSRSLKLKAGRVSLDPVLQWLWTRTLNPIPRYLAPAFACSRNHMTHILHAPLLAKA